MKPINFITPVSPHQQRSLRRWYHVSLLLFSVCFISIIVIQSKQLFALYLLRQDLDAAGSNHNIIQKTLAKQEQLQKHLSSLQHIATSIDTLREHHEKMIESLAILDEQLKTTYIESCAITKTTVSISFRCKHAHNATTIISTINHHHHELMRLHLVSLQPYHASQEFVAHVKGSIIAG